MTACHSARLKARLDSLRGRGGGRGGLVTFITAGDPDAQTSLEILHGLPAAGADIIELGMPFSDPMADGPSIQAASRRALEGGHTMAQTLAMVQDFRRQDSQTPVVLMGYANPIHTMGYPEFLAAAAEAGVDGLIVVDMPPEEDRPLREPAAAFGLDMIRLVTPTADDERMAHIVREASGFLYYVSIAGITGTRAAAFADIDGALGRLARHSSLPVAVGFGLRTPAQVQRIMATEGRLAVVGSALVEVAGQGDAGAVLDFVRTLVHKA